MYQHWQITLSGTLPLLLSVYYRYYRSGPVSSTGGYRNIRTSGRSPYCTGTVYFALVVDPWDLGSPVGFVGWDPSWDHCSRVTAALGRPQKFHRKVPGRSQYDRSRSPQMMGVAQRGRLKFLKMSFWRII